MMCLKSSECKFGNIVNIRFRTLSGLLSNNFNFFVQSIKSFIFYWKLNFTFKVTVLWNDSVIDLKNKKRLTIHNKHPNLVYFYMFVKSVQSNGTANKWNKLIHSMKHGLQSILTLYLSSDFFSNTHTHSYTHLNVIDSLSVMSWKWIEFPLINHSFFHHLIIYYWFDFYCFNVWKFNFNLLWN